MIKTSSLKSAIINAGLTYSAESGDDFPMKPVPITALVKMLTTYLKDEGVNVYDDVSTVSNGLKKYYIARSELARKQGDMTTANSYSAKAEGLPLE